MNLSTSNPTGRGSPKTTTSTMDGELTRGYPFSDLTIVCGDLEFKVHQVVLYSQSDFFRKLLGSGFKEATQSTVEVYAIAHKHAVLSLGAQAATRVGKVLDPTVDLEDFIDAIREIDESVCAGDRTLWDVVIRVARENMGFLLAKEEFMGLMREMPSLMAGLLKLLDASESVPEATSGGRRLG